MAIIIMLHCNGSRQSVVYGWFMIGLWNLLGTCHLIPYLFNKAVRQHQPDELAVTRLSILVVYMVLIVRRWLVTPTHQMLERLLWLSNI